MPSFFGNEDELLNLVRRGTIWSLDENDLQQDLEKLTSSDSEESVPGLKLRSLIAEVADRRGWWQTLLPKAVGNVQRIEEKLDSQETPLSVDALQSDGEYFLQAGWLMLHYARSRRRLGDVRKTIASSRDLPPAEEALDSVLALRIHHASS